MAVEGARSTKFISTNLEPEIRNNRPLVTTERDCLEVHAAESPQKLPPGPPFEQHYSVKQVSEMWSLGVDAVRKLFQDQTHVLRTSHAETLRKRVRTLPIPESVLRRFHRRWSQNQGEAGQVASTTPKPVTTVTETNK